MMFCNNLNGTRSIIGIAIGIIAVIVTAILGLTYRFWGDEAKSIISFTETFTCSDGTSIDADNICDGYSECSEGEDERDCDCGDYESACSSDNVCIYTDWFCDGYEDCSQGEDEQNCGLSCSSSEFECADHSQCIDLGKQCDQDHDCADSSDEFDCLIIEVRSEEPVLLARINGNAYHPVCSSSWENFWNTPTCEELGYGNGIANGEVSAAKIAESSNGVATINGKRGSSTLDVLSLGGSCLDNTAVRLSCAYDSCGTRAANYDEDSRLGTIIQGYQALEGSWPWQVTVEFDGNFICGGSLIDDQWVLTAAHCIDFDIPSLYSVRVGSIKVSGSDQYLQRANAQSLFVNEDYNARTFANDIALIKLDRIIEYTDYVRPICLPDPTETFSDSVVCYTTGWGAWEPSATEYPDLLQEVKMPLISDESCSNDIYIAAAGGIDPNTMQCAGYPSGHITICNGDSGGPIVCRDTRNVWTLAGATSWGVRTDKKNCASISVFAQVSAFISWIEDIQENN